MFDAFNRTSISTQGKKYEKKKKKEINNRDIQKRSRTDSTHIRNR